MHGSKIRVFLSLPIFSLTPLKKIVILNVYMPIHIFIPSFNVKYLCKVYIRFNKASCWAPAMFGPMVFVKHVFYTSKCSVHLALPAARTVSTVGEVAAVGQREDDDFPRSPFVVIEELQRRTADRVEPRRLMTPCTLQTSVNFIQFHTVNMINIAYWLGKNTRFKKAWIQIFSD